MCPYCLCRELLYMIGVVLRFVAWAGAFYRAQGQQPLQGFCYADTKRIQIVFAKAVAKPAHAAI